MTAMKNTNDPYKGILGLMAAVSQRNGIQNGVSVGLVISGPPNIKISYNGMTLTKEQLLVDEYWIPGHTRHVVGSTDYAGGGSGDAAYESHNHPVNNDETLTDTWKPGDRVALIPLYTKEDMRGGQKFIVFGKLRYLD